MNYARNFQSEVPIPAARGPWWQMGGASKKRMIAFVVSVIVIAASTEYALSTIRPSWVFKGAYAEYYGTGVLADNTTFTGNETIKIIDYNSTSAELSISVNLTSPSKSTTNQTTAWVRIHGGQRIDQFSTGQHPNRSYETTILFNEKNISVTAYVYERKLANATTTSVVYARKTDSFALELSISSGKTHLDLLLVKSNIPGLFP